MLSPLARRGCTCGAWPSKWKLGLTEEAVLQAVGQPSHVGSLWSPGQFDKTAGKRYTYRLSERTGMVWIDVDTNMQVIGIFWRDRD
jgi:hypothetical protein